MPYTRFVKRDGTVDVYKKENGREVKAFTSHSSSVGKAKRTAGIREAASRRKTTAKVSHIRRKLRTFKHS